MADNLPSDFDVIVIGTGMCGPDFSWTKYRRSFSLFIFSVSGEGWRETAGVEPGREDRKEVR
jgi:hypothetical protein